MTTRLENIKVIMIIILLVFVAGGAAITQFGHSFQDEIIHENIAIQDSLILEAGSKIPSLEDYVINWGNLDKNSTITYKNLDTEAVDDNLQTTEIYTDQSGKEVSTEEAIDETGAVRPGYQITTVLTRTGTYEITIVDPTTSESYVSQLIVEDNIAPILKVKDMEITEGDTINVNDFVESCNDNSHTACEILKTEIPTTVGVHEISIQAQDAMGNISEAQIAKLTIKEKEKIEVEKSQGVDKDTNTSTNSKTETDTKKDNVNEDTNKNEQTIVTATKNSCLTTLANTSKPLAVDWGCGKSIWSDEVKSLTRKYTSGADSFAGKILARELEACNVAYGDYDCSDFIQLEDAYIKDHSGDLSRGLFLRITVTRCDEKGQNCSGNIVGQGYIKADSSISWSLKKY